MAVDKTSLGVTGEPFPLRVEHGKVREFADAVRADHPAYRAADPVIPPTFLTTRMHWEKWVEGADPWPRVNMDPTRGMHAEQEYVFHGPPPRAGDVLTATHRIDSITEKTGRRGGTLTFVVMVTEFRDTEGRLVAEGRMTAVETGRPPTEGS